MLGLSCGNASTENAGHSGLCTHEAIGIDLIDDLDIGEARLAYQVGVDLDINRAGNTCPTGQTSPAALAAFHLGRNRFGWLAPLAWVSVRLGERMPRARPEGLMVRLELTSK